MTDFLSDAWVEALDARYADTPGSALHPVTVQYDVSMSGGVRSYHVVLGPDRDRAVAGPAPARDVTFTMDEATARAVSAGELSTEEAFITGRLTIDGDPGPLIEAHRSRRDDA